MSEGPDFKNPEQGRIEELESNLLAARAENTILQGDVMLLQKQIEQLQANAIKDYLTEAASRPFLLERLREHFSWLEHRASDEQRKGRLNDLSLMFFDFDNFKQVNDRYTHAAGDNLLKAITRFLRELARDEDTVCRWGGDEFIVCFPDVSEKNAEGMAKRIKDGLDRRLENYLKEQGIGVEVTVSIGIAGYEPGLNVNELIDRADQAMYKVKEAGKDGYLMFHDI